MKVEIDQTAIIPTHHAMLMHVRHNERLHLYHIRFWSRIRTWFTFLLLLFGTAAFAAIFARSSDGASAQLTSAAGLVVAVLSVLNHCLSPADKIAAHRSVFKSYKATHAEAFGLTALDIHRRVREIEKDECLPIKLLETVAFNDTQAAYEGICDQSMKTVETWRHRLVRALA